ncbi:dnaJ homolog subfamily C member 17 [Prorops nasuta]|uniref:dnaJ homolog subfamily C member 17 n=1 Tax=Prorops nasuta TaxID=863751 RepID=UPI0034CDC499
MSNFCDLQNLDLYELVGALPTSSIQEIKKAYRKKSLSCHPDKNPDNPKATELFHQLSKALEILTDESARIAYDKVLNARKQSKLRIKEYDAVRKKFKDILEEKEKAYEESLRQKAEMERLQREERRKTEEEMQRLIELRKEQIENEKLKSFRVKIRWKVIGKDSKQNGYNYDSLYKILSQHGDINALALSATKEGRAIVEFKEAAAAESAVKLETGLKENPLKLQGLWVNTKLAKNNVDCTEGQSTRLFTSHKDSQSRDTRKWTVNEFKEFERSVLDKIKRAQEQRTD